MDIRKTLWTTFAVAGSLALLLSVPMAADQVFLDDVIVDGSACIGFDCVNGESFGFDTLRLKENNLRIKFQDTSNSASFPTNDWQLTANDSSNGGAEKFSIDDITGGRTPFTIEAGAPSHSLFVDSSGRLGIETNNPVVELHIVDGDTPTLRLEQDGSSGFTPQTWDVAGNEAGFFVRDVTNGSTLPFRIVPGAASQSLVVDGDNEVGMSAGINPDAPLHLLRTSGDFDINSDGLAHFESTAADDTEVIIENSNAAAQITGLGIKNADQNWEFRVAANGFFAVTRSGSGVNEIQISDAATPVVTINANLTVTGAGGCTGCDEVFQPDYPVESIEEHADYMWSNSYLPGIGPSPVDAPIEVFQKTAGILNELEKAHIYIEQLHQRLEKLEQALASQ